MTNTPGVLRGRRAPTRQSGMRGRSYRVSDETFTAAKARAEREGYTMSNVTAMLVEGYAKGVFDLPTLVYPSSTTKVPVPAP